MQRQNLTAAWKCVSALDEAKLSGEAPWDKSWTTRAGASILLVCTASKMVDNTALLALNLPIMPIVPAQAEEKNLAKLF